MNLHELERKLWAAARKNPPSDAAPYAFEKRVMAHLRDLKPLNSWALWGRPLWLAAASCAAVMLLVGTWSLLPANISADGDLSQDFENAVFASMDQPIEEVW